MKILLAAEIVTGNPLEGLEVFVMHLVRFLKNIGQLTVVYAIGDPEEGVTAHRVLAPKILLTRKLLALRNTTEFDIVIYVPSSSITSFGLGRGALLRRLFKAPTMIIGLQERRIGQMHRMALALARPDLVLSPVESFRTELRRLGLVTGFILPGFDESRFKPVDKEQKKRLRSKYNLPSDRYIILHVGHIKESRNMQAFLKYRDWGSDILPVVKAGEVEQPWIKRLRLAGIIVIDEYIEAVHELYQAADCYLFPVALPTGALEFPLSVVEAAACNLPVLTTRFGALPGIFSEGDGLIYIGSSAEIPQKLALLRTGVPSTSDKVSDLSWAKVLAKYLQPQLETLTQYGKGDD
jgi:glycosyltransferase involved in cell wall biosynthesis